MLSSGASGAFDGVPVPLSLEGGDVFSLSRAETWACESI